MYIIGENIDVGGRDTFWDHLVGKESVYGGKPFPVFNKKEDAKKFIKNRTDSSYRSFEIIEVDVF